MVSILLSQPGTAVDVRDQVWLTHKMHVHMYAHMHLHKVPYSGKFSKFANYKLFTKILSANVFFVDRDKARVLIRENNY